MLSFGISAIGRVGRSYCQNAKTLPAYYAALDAGRLPVVKGIELTADDLLRRAVIQAPSPATSAPASTPPTGSAAA